MVDITAVAGSKLFIGRRVGLKPDVELSDFAGATWTEIGGLTTLGSLANTQNWVTQSLIANGFDIQVKGTVAGGTMENVFIYDPNDAGQIKLRAAIESCSNYEFKLEAGAGCIATATATISVGTPGVVTVADGHGFDIGSPVVFATTGALPTGLTVGTTYYVIAAGFTATTFSVSTTPGGAGVDTTAVGSGVHTVTGQPVGATALFRGLAGEGSLNGGEANTVMLQTYPIAINSRILRV